jgi:hypothetical protein
VVQVRRGRYEYGVHSIVILIFSLQNYRRAMWRATVAAGAIFKRVSEMSVFVCAHPSRFRFQRGSTKVLIDVTKTP